MYWVCLKFYIASMVLNIFLRVLLTTNILVTWAALHSYSMTTSIYHLLRGRITKLIIIIIELNLLEIVIELINLFLFIPLRYKLRLELWLSLNFLFKKQKNIWIHEFIENFLPGVKLKRSGTIGFSYENFSDLNSLK